MRIYSSATRQALTHRYFPEWADRPERDGALPEAERNSYSAGGYAEEFGYGGQSGLPALAPTFEEDPEDSSQWRVFIGCLHPGYPECPKPLARDGYPAGTSATDADAALHRPTASEAGGHSTGRSPHLNVIRADELARRNSRNRTPRLWRVLRIRLRGF